MTRVGLVGLDMSHAVAFADMLNDAEHPDHVPGGRVTVGFIGGSPDIELSRSRVGGYVQHLRDRWALSMVDTAAEVAAAADIILITAVDGRQHRTLFEQVVPFKKPTFIGKPMALSSEDARVMFDLADLHEAMLMSSSALRFSDAFVTAAGEGKTNTGCDVFGPAPLEATQPGLFWYGIHAVEMAVAAMGVGCIAVSSVTTDTTDLTTLRYDDGRLASVRGSRDGSTPFGLTIHRANGSTYADTVQHPASITAGLLRAIMLSLPRGISLVPTAETLEVIRIVEAANISQATGRAVPIASSR